MQSQSGYLWSMIHIRSLGLWNWCCFTISLVFLKPDRVPRISLHNSWESIPFLVFQLYIKLHSDKVFGKENLQFKHFKRLIFCFLNSDWGWQTYSQPPMKTFYTTWHSSVRKLEQDHIAFSVPSSLHAFHHEQWSQYEL